MAYGIEATGKIRDEIHNIDCSGLESSKRRYNKARRQYLLENEAFRGESYLDDGSSDGQGNVTIGIGFNMQRPEARREWDSFFKGKVDFDDAFFKRVKITRTQAEELADFCLDQRVKELRRYYKQHWNKLRYNERLAIESAYYTNPDVVRGKLGSKKPTNFYTNMIAYVKTGETEHLKAAVYELQYRSNPKKPENAKLSDGMQNRRNSEAELLSSYKCPMYSKPGQPVVLGPGQLNGPFVAKVSKTIVPRNPYDEQFNRYLTGGPAPQVEPWLTKSSDYYIWRAQGDGRVRKSHGLNDGRVFKKSDPPATGHPGDEHGCRCYAEELPEHLEVRE